MVGVAIHAERLNEVQRALGRIARGEDRAAMMEQIGAYGEASTVQRFEEQRGPDGTPWKPSERARKESGQTLVDEGHLRGSITHLSSADSAEWGSNRVYAGIHQTGGAIKHGARTSVLAFNTRGRFASRASTGRRKSGTVRIAIVDHQARETTMPARPFLGLSDADRQEIGAIAVDHLRRQLRP